MEKINFKEPGEIITFFKENAYEAALKELPSDVLHMIGLLQNTGRCGKEDMKKVAEAIEKMPPTSNELVAWRCGDMMDSDKLFLSATLWEAVAKKHQGYNGFGEIHPIVIFSGARFLPLAPVNSLLFGLYDDPELEVLLDTSRLVKCGGVYQYR